MRNFIQKALVASSVATAGVVVAATASFAQTAGGATSSTVNFAGTVQSTCEFTQNQSGALDLNPSDGSILTSKAGIGQSGSVNLSCSGNATLAIAEPTKLVGPDLDTEAGAAILSSEANFDDGSGVDTILGGEPAVDLAGAVTDMLITVDMTADSAEPIPSGNYTFGVELTATPL